MSYYQVLDRPEGTYPFKQGIGTQLSGISRAGAKGMTDMIFRKAAEREGMTPSYKRTAPGEWDVGYEKPKEQDFKTKMMLYLAGFAPPPKGVEKQVEEISPFKVGEAGGGEVMTPFGTTAEGGQYKDPTGKIIGEYAPGAEGERMAEPVRTKLRQQISYDEFARKAFGMPKKEKEEPEGYQESLSNAIQAVEQGMDSWKVFQKLAQAFPEKSAELKRILIPAARLGDVDISEALWGK